MENIVPSAFPQGKYYVYTLAYPKSMSGAIFYVGKGTSHPGYTDRIDTHEMEAKRSVQSFKCDTIRKIWDAGEQVTKEKVAFFQNELDAYMYEWALMNMTTYAEVLTNIQRGSGRLYSFENPARLKPKVENAPYIHTGVKNWGCFKSPTGRIYHEVQDIHSFARRNKIGVMGLIDIANGIPYSRSLWRLARECPRVHMYTPTDYKNALNLITGVNMGIRTRGQQFDRS